MKRLILAILLTASFSATAGGYHSHPGHWHRHNNAWVWVVPTIVGGVIGYEIARHQPTVVTQPQPPVIIQQTTQPNCSPWTEVQHPDGTITRTRTCQQ